MDRAITASEANQRFSELLRRIAEGDSFTVTSHGRPVARMLAVEHTKARALHRLLAFVSDLPVRHSGDWSRDDLYE